LPEDAIASRIAGDSFLVYLPNHDAEQAAARARVILRDATQCSVGTGDKSIALSLSCGVVRIQSVQAGLGGPIATAQRACAGCHASGGNCVEIHLDVDPSMMRRKKSGGDVFRLQNAPEESRFCICAQKIVSSADFNLVHGIECFVRMQDDTDQTIVPVDKVIDHSVISNTLRKIRPFRTMLFEAQVNIAINVSDQCIEDEVFIESIERWLAKSKLAPGLMLFEITETIAGSNLSRAERLIARLRRHGCRFALVRFGAGVDSLSYLKALPVSYVKIDGSFTRELVSDERSASTVQTIVQIAQSLGIKSIAENVESLPLAERVRDLAVDYLQGAVVHRPETLRRTLDSIAAAHAQRHRQSMLEI